MKKRTFALVFLLASSVGALALAQTRATPHPPRHASSQPQIQPIAAPEEHGKDVEEEPPPAPFKFFDTQILNNKQPPYAAVLLNFVLLALIYYRFGKKPIAEALKERKHSIASAIENAQKILREAKQRSKRYRAKLEQVDADMDEAKQSLASTGEGEAHALFANAEEKAKRIARDAQFLLEQEKKQTQIDLLRATVEDATKQAEALLRSNVTSQDHERLAEEFLKQLEADYAGGLG